MSGQAEPAGETEWPAIGPDPELAPAEARPQWLNTPPGYTIGQVALGTGQFRRR